MYFSASNIFQVVLICLAASASVTLAESQEKLITGESQTESHSLEDISPQKESDISDVEEEMNRTGSLVNIKTNGECTELKQMFFINLFSAQVKIKYL